VRNFPVGKELVTAQYRDSVAHVLRQQLPLGTLQRYVFDAIAICRNDTGPVTESKIVHLKGNEEVVAAANVRDVSRVARLASLVGGNALNGYFHEFLTTCDSTLRVDGMTLLELIGTGLAFDELPLCLAIERRARLGEGGGTARVGMVVAAALQALQVMSPTSSKEDCEACSLLTHEMLNLRHPGTSEAIVARDPGLQIGHVMDAFTDALDILVALFGDGGPAVKSLRRMQHLERRCVEGYPSLPVAHLGVLLIQHLGALCIDATQSTGVAAGRAWASRLRRWQEAGEDPDGLHIWTRAFSTTQQTRLMAYGNCDGAGAGGGPSLMPLQEGDDECEGAATYFKLKSAVGWQVNEAGVSITINRTQKITWDEAVPVASPGYTGPTTTPRGTSIPRDALGRACPLLGAKIRCRAGPAACYFDHRLAAPPSNSKLEYFHQRLVLLYGKRKPSTPSASA